MTLFGNLSRIANQLLCVAATWLLAAEVLAQDPALVLEGALTRVIEQSEPSVVSIARIRQVPAEAAEPHPIIQRFPPNETPRPPLDPENPDFQPNSYGVGILIATQRQNERLVLTNYHVIQGGPIASNNSPFGETGMGSGAGVALFVRFADRRSCYATIVAADPRSDLAVIRLTLSPAGIDENDLKPMDWSTSTPARKGQLVVMLGNPYSLAHDGSASASWGMISNLARRPLPWTEDQSSKFMMYRLGDLIQIDGRLNQGTSGGPLLNLKGELIGITTSLAAVEGYEKASGFAIPIDELTRRIVKSLVAGHEVEYGMLGIAPEDVTPSKFRHLAPGVKQASAARVGAVQVDGPAARAGIQQGDLLLAVGDVPIYTEYDLMRVVGLHAPETEIELLVSRNQRKPFPVKVTLGKWPAWEDERIIETSPRYPAWRGITVDYPTGRKKFAAGVQDPYRRAVVITKVATDSPAHAVNLQPGVFITEVNRVSVQTPGEFYEATKSLRGPVDLRYSDDGRHYEIKRLTIGE